jgi:hypothetical protein
LAKWAYLGNGTPRGEGALHASLLVVGMVVAIAGALLLFVPVYPLASYTTTAGATPGSVGFNVTGFSLTGTIPVAVSWTAGSSVLVEACLPPYPSVPTLCQHLLSQNGTSDSFELNLRSGEEFVISVLLISPLTEPSPTSVTFKVSYAPVSIGLAVLIIGGILLVLGAVLRSGKAPATFGSPKLAPTPSKSRSESPPSDLPSIPG